VQTNYNTTSAVFTPVHPAYAAADTPSRGILAFIRSPDAKERWALPEDIAAAMYKVASRGEKIPLRVPLGQDAWLFLKQEVETLSKEFDEVRELSESVGGDTKWKSDMDM
jgi:hypothetical protein